MDIFFILLSFLLPVFYFLFSRRRSTQRLPPGSLGIPFIGQSLSLLRAMRTSTSEKWFEERARKYGPISKLILFGKPTVFIHGPAANKLVFGCDANKIINQQAQSTRMLIGNRSLIELNGEDHKRVRDALVSFLRPECLKQYVGKADLEVRRHLDMHWEGKEIVTVLPLMKNLTFNIISTMLFGIEHGARRDALLPLFHHMMQGMWSIPLNLPFTRFNRSLKASAKMQIMVRDLVREKRAEIEKATFSPQQDLISRLLSIRGEDGKQLLSENEIVDNIILVMLAGHDTSSILLTFMIQILSIYPTIYAALLQEQEEIARSKPSGELLNWEDLAKMKYTWRVAQETLRIYYPVLGSLRKAANDIEYGGYIIPKGWQVLWATNMTHMDGTIFEEPTKFDPARFENPSSVPSYCFIPFGAGPRICPGYEFAKLETLVAIHHLVTRFTWKLCCTDMSYTRDPMPNPPQGLPIEIMPKKLC